METHAYEQLRADYSELLADYAHLKNSEEVLTETQMRFTIDISATPEDDVTQLIKDVAATITDTGATYKLTLAHGGALLKFTTTPK